MVREAAFEAIPRQDRCGCVPAAESRAAATKPRGHAYHKLRMAFLEPTTKAHHKPHHKGAHDVGREVLKHDAVSPESARLGHGVETLRPKEDAETVPDEHPHDRKA